MIPYLLKKSAKAKRITIRINQNAQVIITAPKAIPQSLVEQFIISKQDWIQEKLAAIPENIYTSEHYQIHKAGAKAIISARVKDWATVMQLSYNRIKIGNMRTRWGSCSSKGNLSFSYRLMFLGTELMDYVIIHELAHRQQMNHSKLFWQIVAKYCPEYQSIRKSLTRITLAQ